MNEAYDRLRAIALPKQRTIPLPDLLVLALAVRARFLSSDPAAATTTSADAHATGAGYTGDDTEAWRDDVSDENTAAYDVAADDADDDYECDPAHSDAKSGISDDEDEI